MISFGAAANRSRDLLSPGDATAAVRALQQAFSEQATEGHSSVYRAKSESRLVSWRFEADSGDSTVLVDDAAADAMLEKPLPSCND
jgi:hypothetical protein